MSDLTHFGGTLVLDRLVVVCELRTRPAAPCATSTASWASVPIFSDMNKLINARLDRLIA